MTHVLPVLEYASPIWSPQFQNQRDQSKNNFYYMHSDIENGNIVLFLSQYKHCNNFCFLYNLS